jgi:uncharacterized membrane protein YphA (DoxX/SURF4 family)
MRMHWLVFIVEGLLAAAFLMAGWTKVSGSEMQRKAFAESYHYPLGLMYFIGAMEVLGGLGLLVGYWAPILAVLAAAGLTIIMVGAVATHLRLRDTASHMLPALVLLVLVLLVFFGRLSFGI